MTWIEDFAKEQCAKSKEFAEAYAAEKEKLNIAVALTQLRDDMGLTQQQLADISGKPQSTIARIEKATTNPTVGLLAEIAASVGRKLEVRFSEDPNAEKCQRATMRDQALQSVDDTLASAHVAAHQAA